jgi:tRNA (guanine26-N2/guanine27-N2)-dimethyltransferase
MAVDRDLGVAFVRAWAGPAPAHRTGWEATAATGVRGLRLLAETDAFVAFRFTESHPAAVEVLSENARTHAGAVVELGDGRAAPAGATFDYVDVDPYGTPVPFFPATLGAVRAGGVLGVTATDMIVLAGAQPSVTTRRYGARPVRGRLGPESGLRILLGYLARFARSTGRSVRPLLAYARDHYVRAYLEVGADSAPPDPVGSIDPASWNGPPLDGNPPFGPMWLGPIADPALVARLAVPATAERPREVGRFIERLREEAAVPAPFYYEPNLLASRLGLPRPPAIARLIAGLGGRGYAAARTHARPEGIRTTAPRAVVEATARAVAGDDQSQNARVRA